VVRGSSWRELNDEICSVVDLGWSYFFLGVVCKGVVVMREISMNTFKKIAEKYEFDEVLIIGRRNGEPQPMVNFALRLPEEHKQRLCEMASEYRVAPATFARHIIVTVLDELWPCLKE
jgi:hypothetical protein